MVLQVNTFDTSANELLSNCKAALRFATAPPGLEPSYFRLVVLGWVLETETSLRITTVHRSAGCSTFVIP